MSAILYGAGVGPGDPGLITLKAAEVIKQADVIAIPEKKEKCRAYQIAVKAVPEAESKEIIDLAFPMDHDENARKAQHEKLFEMIRERIADGKNVVFLTIGDPAIYSTFSYIADLAQQNGIKTRTISGVTSASACASALGIDLCLKDEALHIFPGSENIEEALKLPGTKVFMKGGSNLAKLKEILSKKGDSISVYAVSRCGMEDERIFASLNDIPDDAVYLTTVIVKEK